METTAYLSNKGEYSFFTYNGRIIKFLTGKNLEKYIRVTEWDSGYLVVISKNYNRPEEEDYIDLNPILENLLMDAGEFLKHIKEVKIVNA